MPTHGFRGVGADILQPGARRIKGLAAKIEALPEAGRMNAIRGMVDGLAARLAQNGQDVVVGQFD